MTTLKRVLRTNVKNARNISHTRPPANGEEVPRVRGGMGIEKKHHRWHLAASINTEIRMYFVFFSFGFMRFYA